jgi:imidazoleglycerol phosphate synthase glutamine amidotransferase subunit HisH
MKLIFGTKSESAMNQPYAFILWKMIDLQHHYNNCTTPPHMGWGPVCGVHPHVRGCCAVVVMMLCRNQIPHMGWGPVCGVHPHMRGYCVVVVMMLCRNQISYFIFKVKCQLSSHLYTTIQSFENYRS